MWDLTFGWVEWEKLNRKCKVSNNSFFFGAEVANSYKHVTVWTRYKSLKEETFSNRLKCQRNFGWVSRPCHTIR